MNLLIHSKVKEIKWLLMIKRYLVCIEIKFIHISSNMEI